MKRTNKPDADELREEYIPADMAGAVRGKYAKRFEGGSNVIMLDPDVAKAFPNEESVNEALRLLINVAKSTSRRAS